MSELELISPCEIDTFDQQVQVIYQILMVELGDRYIMVYGIQQSLIYQSAEYWCNFGNGCQICPGTGVTGPLLGP